MIDTPFVTVSVDDNITVYDKTTHEAYEDFICFEDRGDIGNEYIYFQPKGTEPIFAELKGYEVLENTARYAKILLKHELTVPVSADEKLEEEQKGIIEFMKREAGRSEELTNIPLETELTVHKSASRLALLTLPRITVSVSWSRLITRVQAMILKVSMRW
ncbi:alpha mannosidase [Streptococcus pneumoniae]|nr:alpha mannosidase [Streptococcus pneumoniae]VNL04616.1 alpha mannosidase [Streptococcus pneumoniae]